MNNWENFKRLDALNITFRDNYAAKSAEIFANNNNQVPVLIEIRILNNDNQPMQFTVDELLHHIKLVNFKTGGGINSAWTVGSKEAEYSTPYAYKSIYNSDEVSNREKKAINNYVTLYVKTNKISAEDISVEIDIPFVGRFNTSSNGTSTLNGPQGLTGGTFKSPSTVHVESLTPIDYSNGLENLAVTGMPTKYSDLTLRKDNVYIYQNGDDYWNGQSSTAEIIISSTAKVSSLKVTGKSIKVSQGWTFRCLSGYADAVYGANGFNYDTLFMFVDTSTYGFKNDNEIYISNQSRRWRKYMIYPTAHIYSWTTAIPQGKIKVNLCNHRIPDINGQLWQSGWYDQPTQYLDVIDFYGNKSKIKLTITKDTWPGFSINDVMKN